MSDAECIPLEICLLRVVQIVVKGTTNNIALAPSFSNGMHDWLAEALKGRKADANVESFLLNNVVRNANVVLNTSDLSRVRLTRGGVKMTFDLTAKTPPEVWLEDGDVIEIPEIGEGAAQK
jgi:hypothetical protein